MTPTLMLALASAAFLATHFVSSTPLRPALVARMGERPYQGLYTVVALATLGWMSWAFAQAPREPLFSGFREISYVLMPIAFVLLVCGFGRNPTIVGAEKLLRSEDPARGDVKSLIFFGTLLVLAALGGVSLDSRKKSNPDWARFASVTSHIPFQAVLEKRNRIVCYFATLSFHP